MDNFICWNCRGFKNKRHEIRELISDHGPICLALQETYLKINDTVTIRGYSCYRKDFHHPTRATGGVAYMEFTLTLRFLLIINKFLLLTHPVFWVLYLTRN